MYTNFHKTYFKKTMMNVIIKGIYAVGMHHWGQRSLQIDDVLYVKNEPDNHFDNF